MEKHSEKQTFLKCQGSLEITINMRKKKIVVGELLSVKLTGSHPRALPRHKLHYGYFKNKFATFQEDVTQVGLKEKGNTFKKYFYLDV